MRAAVLRQGAIVVRDDVAEPVPSFGQVLVGVKACGICGSDLHFAKHGEMMLELTDQMAGLPQLGLARTDLGRDVFMGHEFAAEILAAGPDTMAPPPGTLVTSIPLMIGMDGVEPLLYSNNLPCGYSERMLLSAPLLQEVPNGLSARLAALTEPMAVGAHAVNRSAITRSDGALVLGCGPVGIAVVSALKRRGAEPIVAADFSPTRRGLAVTMGAHHAVDPAVEPAFEAWSRVGGGRSLVVFEAVGGPGIIDDTFRWSPPRTRIVVIGVCMGRDAITPLWAVTKELQVQFVFAYEPQEFNDTLRAIADGSIDVSPMITGDVSLDGVAGAFDELGTPERHCKIMVIQ
jgi:threonine dehydrogenase-like Zn-dependent dehydrogenase